MEIVLRKAELGDIDFLVALRLEVLRAANGLDETTPLFIVERNTRRYYEQNLGTGSHIEYLAFSGDSFVGCGAASIYQVMPTYNNPTGKKAYVMNMYTRKAYRHRGVARSILDRLIAEIESKQITHIYLEATCAGRSLYEKYGFHDATDEMELVLV